MSDETTSQPSGEDARVEQGVEEQVQAEMAQGAGVKQGADWEETARRIESKIKSEMASWVGTQPEASWAEIGQGMERRTKEALGRWAGATAEDDWDEVGRKIEARIRQEAARASGIEAADQARWDEIGRRVEQRVRGRLGAWAGAEPDADWAAVANRFQARIMAGLRHIVGERPPRTGTGEPTAQEGGAGMTQTQTPGSGARWEEIRVSGEQLLEKVKQLIHEGNVRRVVIKQGDRVIVEFPLTLGVVGALLLPTLAAVGAIAALVTECTILVEREP